MNNVAPVCPVSRSQLTTAARAAQRTQPPGVDVASIPRAHNLITVINAINRMVNVVTKITRGEPVINNINPPKPFGYVTLKPTPPHYEQPDWIEEHRDYKDNKIVNPDDPDQWISVKTLSVVIFVDRTTGYQMTYYNEN